MIDPKSIDIQPDPLAPTNDAPMTADGLVRHRFDHPSPAPGADGYDEWFCRAYEESTRTANLSRLAAACFGRKLLVMTPEGIVSALSQIASGQHVAHAHETIDAAVKLLAHRQNFAFTKNSLDGATVIAGPFRLFGLLLCNSIVHESGVMLVSPGMPLPPLLTRADLPASFGGQQPYWHLFHEIGHLFAHEDGLECPNASFIDRHRHECYAETFATAMMLVQGVSRSAIMTLTVLGQPDSAIDFLPPRYWPNHVRSRKTGRTPGAWLAARIKANRATGHRDSAYAAFHAQMEGLAHVGWAPRTVADARRAAIYGARHGALTLSEMAPDMPAPKLRSTRRSRVRDLIRTDDMACIEDTLARRIMTPCRRYDREVTDVPASTTDTINLRWTMAHMADWRFASDLTQSMEQARRDFVGRYRAARRAIHANVVIDAEVVGPQTVF